MSGTTCTASDDSCGGELERRQKSVWVREGMYCSVVGNDAKFDVLVVIGPKCLKKFKRLMLHRINWNPDKRGDGTYMKYS